MGSQTKSAFILAKTAKNSTVEEFVRLVKRVSQQLATEKEDFGHLKICGRLIELLSAGEAIVVGDLHGDLESIVHILDETNFLVKMGNKKEVYLIFLGDYGDRGINSPEVYYVVLALKDLFPENVILLRGNHEGPRDLMASPHDLHIHLRNKFATKGTEAYLALRELFDTLYTAVIIKDRYVLVHGGAPSQATTINDIAYAHKTHPREQHLEEILWNDPWTGIKGTIASPRGAGRLFGEDITNKFLEMFNAKVLIRSHQCCLKGYESMHNGAVLTVFSTKSPPYPNKTRAYLQLNLQQNTAPRQLLKGLHQF